MGKISVDDLQEGMVLLSDVKSGSQTLLAQGVTLTNKSISVFKSWGVINVEIEGITEQQLKKNELKRISPEKLEEVEKILKHKFHLVDLKYYPAAILYKACLLEKTK